MAQKNHVVDRGSDPPPLEATVLGRHTGPCPAGDIFKDIRQGQQVAMLFYATITAAAF